MNVTVIRNFNTFGPRQRSTGYGGAIPIFIRKVLQGMPPIIYGNGKQTRDYVYIKDVVQAYDKIFNGYENLAGKAINFGSGKEVDIVNLANMIIKLAGNNLEPVHVDPRPGEVGRLCADIRRASEELGFQPEYDLEKGLMDYIDWYKKGKYEEWRAYAEQSEF
jgi:UDP-glucose 4-epimerase